VVVVVAMVAAVAAATAVATATDRSVTLVASSSADGRRAAQRPVNRAWSP